MREVILHCSDSPNFKAFAITDVRSWHIDRGFNDVGYHYVIEVNGNIAAGRKEGVIGAHCLGQNRDSIGICMIGCDKFTDLQWEALVSLLQDIENRYPSIEIHGHYEYSYKTCPNFNVKEFCKKYNL